MKPLKDILYGVRLVDVKGSTDITIASIHFDSREVVNRSVFVAIKGSQSDGHHFIDSAIKNGASAIVLEEMPQHLLENVTYVVVKNSADAMAVMAANYYDHPSKELSLVAVTGTNGKTSIVTLLYNLFTDLGYPSGLISTVENKIDRETIPSTHTTPNALSVNQLLRKMVDAGCSYAFMEASSHGIQQSRVHGLMLKGAIFSNITHDHLDYHGSFKQYIYSKKRLFDELPNQSFSLINRDDRNGKVMVQNTVSKVYTYALHHRADFMSKVLENDFSGLMLYIDGHELHVRLVGEFNASNILAVYACAMILDQKKEDVLTSLSRISGASGRFEYIVSPQKQIVGIVDYAHTPDALKKVLETIQLAKQEKEKVITVVGCGGNRDKEKRPLMAAVAAKLSDRVVLTSDNPRMESPEEILQQMTAGIPVQIKDKVLVITHRDEAIRVACSLASDRDIVLVAGKGHENYQEIKGKKYPFDDKEELIKSFKSLQI